MSVLVCVCESVHVCVCVCVRERERERESLYDVCVILKVRRRNVLSSRVDQCTLRL
jgi:hypothetical protein